MDPTAPNTNNGNQQPTQNQTNPIQPGQFVVASEETLANPPSQISNQTQVDSATQQNSPDGSITTANQTGQPDTVNPNSFTASAAQDPNLQFQGPPPPPPAYSPPAPGQPDPAPFAQQPSPIGPPPGGMQAPQDSGSNKIKIILIAAGVISLIIIIAVLVWFFVLNKQSTETNSTSTQEVEIPSPATQTQGPGFGTIPESTEQGQPSAPDQVAPSQTPAAPDTTQTTIPPTQ